MFEFQSTAMYRTHGKSRAMELEYGCIYAEDFGEVWSIYFAQIDIGDERPWLKLIFVLYGFFSAPAGQNIISQVPFGCDW